jgi:putative MATE family efflux protein
LFLGLVIVGFASFMGFLTINPVFSLMGADEQTLPLVRQYMEVWYLTMIFLVIPFVGNSAIRSTGDTFTPSVIMVFAVLINATLDPLLIFGFGAFPGWGIRGAAVATAISRMFTLVFSLYILGKRKRLLTNHFPGWSVLVGCWKSILYIGIPTAFSRMIVPIATSIVIALVAVYGEAAVAAWGVGTRLEMVSLSIIWALSAVIAPFIGQNLGAEKIGRIQRALKLSSLFSMAWGALMFALLNLFPETIASWFNDDYEVIQYTSWFLMIVPVGFGFQGIQLIVTSNLNTLGKPIPAFMLSAVHMLGLYVPLAYFGSQYRGFLGMMAGILIANILGGALQWMVNSYITRKVCEDFDAKLAERQLKLQTEATVSWRSLCPFE